MVLDCRLDGGKLDAAGLAPAVQAELQVFNDLTLQIQETKKQLDRYLEQANAKGTPIASVEAVVKVFTKRIDKLEVQGVQRFKALEQIDPELRSKLKAGRAAAAPNASSVGEALADGESVESGLSPQAREIKRQGDLAIEGAKRIAAEVEGIERGVVTDPTRLRALAADMLETINQIRARPDLAAACVNTLHKLEPFAKILPLLDSEIAALRRLDIGAARSRMLSLPQRINDFLDEAGLVEKDSADDGDKKKKTKKKKKKKKKPAAEPAAGPTEECADPTLDEKKKSSEDIYRLKQEQLGLLVEMLDKLCPDAIDRSVDHISINMDAIPTRAFRECASQVEVWLQRADEPVAEPPPPPPKPLTGAAALLETLDKFRAENGGVDDPYYAAMRSALEELEIEEREEQGS